MALEDKFLEELEKGQKFTQGVSSLDLFSAWENDTETLSDLLQIKIIKLQVYQY